jgi:hypothetical protein
MQHKEPNLGEVSNAKPENIVSDEESKIQYEKKMERAERISRIPKVKRIAHPDGSGDTYEKFTKKDLKDMKSLLSRFEGSSMPEEKLPLRKALNAVEEILPMAKRDVKPSKESHVGKLSGRKKINYIKNPLNDKGIA